MASMIDIAPHTSEFLSLFQILLIISIPGAFGGFAAALIDIDGKKVKVCMLISRACIGIAGAFGVVLIGFWAGKITVDKCVLNQLFLISFSLIGGTISYKILPKIGTKLEEQLQLQLEETKREFVDTVDKKSTEVMNYSAAVASADAALARNNASDIKMAIEMLSNLKNSFPIDRTLHIKLGRLFRKEEDYNKAILTLRDFIDELNKEHSDKGSHSHFIQDSADAYFNIACYHSLKAEKMKQSHDNQDEIDRLVKEALEALKASVDLMSRNKEAAMIDEDFNFIKNKKEFKELIEI